MSVNAYRVFYTHYQGTDLLKKSVRYIRKYKKKKKKVRFSTKLVSLGMMVLVAGIDRAQSPHTLFLELNSKMKISTHTIPF